MEIKPLKVKKPVKWKAHKKEEWENFILYGKPLAGPRCWKCNGLVNSPNGQCPARYNHER